MRRGAIIRRALSNVLLGITVGVLSYYALTSALGWLQQRELRDESADTPIFVQPDPADALEPEDGSRDFSGWEEQDEPYWAGLQGDDAFGRLVVPAIGLDVIVVGSTSTADLRRGPGWMDWTALPGPSGTVGIAGHRTTYGAPFRRLDELEPGDTIDLYSPFRRYRYRVLRTLVVRPDQTEVLHPEEQPSLVLSACHPPYSARYRIVVQAELTEVQRTAEQESE